MDARKLKVLWTKAMREGRSRGSALLDRALYVLGVPPSLQGGAVPKQALFYVCEMLPARAGRLAKWVHRADGAPIVLLCHRDGFIPGFAEQGFAQVLLFRNAWHLRRLLRALPTPRLVHGFAPKSRYPDVARCAWQPKGVPYIHDLQDTLVVYYGTTPHQRWLRAELPHERACMAGADGLVAHSLEPNEGFRRYGIARKDRPPTLFFPLYCDDDAFVTDVPKIGGTEVHLVYAGGVAGSHRDPRHYGNIQFFGLIRTLTSQGLHFHLYPSPTNIRADVEEYEALAKANARFHFHAPVAQEKLAGELAKYHFGLLPFFKERSEQSDAKLKYATTLKLFNYLEAGLPIIVSRDLGYQSWLVERYRIGIAIALNDVGSLAGILGTLAGTSIGLRTKALLIGTAIDRATGFYDQLSPR